MDWLTPITSIGEKLITPITSLISEFVEDKDKRAELMAKAAEAKDQADLTIQMAVMQLQLQIAKNEEGSSAFYKNWRPFLMWVIAGMLACYGINNFLVYPILQYFNPGMGFILILDWEFVSLVGSITGVYVIGRAVEKKAEITNRKGGAR